ncbi:MAG: BrnT family toxin [Armatimonadetes bacterium]|nr:BrnT family toxin [Armatimonadota bacterium]
MGPSVRISEIVWTEDDVAHLAQHGVTPEEIEEVLAADPLWRRGRAHLDTGRRSLYALGKTDAGRYLFIVLSLRGRGRARYVTAMDMDKKARRYYERHRR